MVFDVILRNWHVKVICFVIAMILVFFTRANSLKEEPVVVFLETKTNNNYTFTESLPSRVTLTLKGEESEIKKVLIDDLSVFIDATAVEKDGNYTLPVLINQNKVFGKTKNVEITVDPPFIETTIEEKITKYLRVESVITGIPAHGYELNSRFVNPAVISVSGPRSHLQDISGIKTDPVDVTGKISDFIMRVKLDKSDPLLSFPEGEFVEFRGIISETSAVKVIENVNIAVKGLKENLEIVGELPQISVNVEGKLLSLEDFTKNNISLTINLEDVTGPGTYEVPISHWTPRFAHVFNKSRDKISVVIREKTGEE